MKTAKATKASLARELGVSRASLYYKPKKPPEDEEMLQKIKTVMDDHRAYGSRRVAWALGLNRKRTKRLMKKHGLKPRIRRGQRPNKPDDVGKPETLVRNIPKVLCPIRANILWAGDFTYIWFMGQFWYLATAIDIFTREIVGWHIAKHHTTALIVEAFRDGVRRMEAAPTWFHSDQGSEYLSGDYGEVLMAYGTQPSHSGKGKPWQNGFQESFYSHFKLELGDVRRFTSVGELIEAIHQQIAYYNNQRIHSAIKMPPVLFRTAHQQTLIPA